MGFFDLFRKKKQEKVEPVVKVEKPAEIQEPEIPEEEVEKVFPMLESILNGITAKFFPSSGLWYSYCFSRPEGLSKKYINCHLRDTEWLANMFKEENVGIKLVPLKTIKRYIETSEFFAEKRHDYELEVVRWQIDWMRNGGQNWKCPKGHETLSIFEENLDTRFRGGVYDTLTAIGMDGEVVEEGIEKFADMWRRRQMEVSFDQRYQPIMFSFVRKYEPLPRSDEKFMEAWIALREYEYYLTNQASVDKYGKKTPAMLMTPEEALALESYVKEKGEERLAFIDYFRDHNFVEVKDPFGLDDDRMSYIKDN